MKKIELLPKFYNKNEIKNRQKELELLRSELVATGKLTNKEIEELNDMNLVLCGDAYSRNYEIKRINELAVFVNCR